MIRAMDAHGTAIEFSLSAPTLDFSVEVSLRRAGERWVARVLARDESRIGMGESARRALAAALTPLGASAVSALLADLGLLEPSLRVADLEAAAAR